MKFIDIIKSLITEQTKTIQGGYVVGDVLRAKRSRDGKEYELTVYKISPGGVDGTILVKSLDGKGKLGNNILDGKVQHRVSFRRNIEAEDSELGDFTNVRKIGGSTSPNTSQTSGVESGRDPKMYAGKASKEGTTFLGTKSVKGATAQEKELMGKGKAIKSVFQ